MNEIAGQTFAASTESNMPAAAGARTPSDGHELSALAAQLPAQPVGDEGQIRLERQMARALIAEIREHWYQRQALHRAEKSLTLQMKASCRRLCSGDKKEADVVYVAMEAGDHPLAGLAMAANLPFLEARRGIAASRKAQEKMLTALANKLPAAAWPESVRGFGMLGLAAIVGEAGDLTSYATKERLWKRMGVAVMPDGRQRRMMDKELAARHGFSPRRRAVLFTIGDSLFKHQSGQQPGPYRRVYDARRARTDETHPDWTKAHSHNDALRVMSKRLLEDLWRAWRREAKNQVCPRGSMPPAEAA